MRDWRVSKRFRQMVEIRAEGEPLKDFARPRVRLSPLLAQKWKERGGWGVGGQIEMCLSTAIARMGKVATTAAVKITVIIFGGLLGSCLKV